MAGDSPSRSATPAAAFVAGALIAPRPAPLAERGLLAFARARLVGSPSQVLLTLFGALLLLAVVPSLVRFLVIDAVWAGAGRAACLPVEGGPPMGACWPFIAAKLDQLIYGFYPRTELWRVNLVYALGAVLLVPLLVPGAPLKRWNALAFFGAYPVAAFVLLTGGGFELKTFLLGRIGLGGLFAGLPAPWGLRLGFWADFGLTALAAIGLAALAGRGEGRAGDAARGVAAGVLALGLVLLAADLDFGLAPVETTQWGGLLVTLVIAVTGISVSLPLGILLALARRSRLPLVKAGAVVFIEFWRGVPLVTVLFFATYMLPFFLPGHMTVDGLLRALVGVALFAAAYMAEVVRGGLQAIPRGQYEGALALGLRPRLALRLVVLPQALRLVIPGIVNTFIGLFKDTTLVLIVSIFDLLGSLRAAFADPNWSTPSTLFTGFAFVGLIYFAFCAAMSRYSLALEKRLDRNRRS